MSDLKISPGSLAIGGQEILAIVDHLLVNSNPSVQLTDVQSIVLRHTWEEYSYQQVADDLGYQVDYVRQLASSLWRILSAAMGEKVCKKNLHSVLRRYCLRQPMIIHSASIEIAQGIQDWGEAIDTAIFYGRHAELTQLEQWIAWNRCRLVGIYGLGGIGKTLLSVKLANKLTAHFDYIVWRSLEQAPDPLVLGADILQVLVGSAAVAALTPAVIIGTLLQQLQEKRCLLIFDNVDAILQAGEQVGQCLPGYEAYAELFELIAMINHQSCLLITAREQPQGLDQWGGEYLPVRSINLKGLSDKASRQILADKGLVASSLAAEDALIEHLAGNPLALKMAATKIHNLFGGDLAAFLAQGHTVFSDLWELFDRQFQRLSPLQHSLMYWLALGRFGCNVRLLQSATQLPMREILTALEALHQRSWIKSTTDGLIQQPAVTEYVTERLVSLMAPEIISGELEYCRIYLLPWANDEPAIGELRLRPGAKNKISPVWPSLMEYLLANFATESQLKQHLGELLAQLPLMAGQRADYAAHNIKNICSYLDGAHSSVNESPLELCAATESLIVVKPL
jgi:NB-ARC domain